MAPRKKQASEEPEVLPEKEIKAENQTKKTSTRKVSKDKQVPAEEHLKAEVEATINEHQSEHPAVPVKPTKGSLDRGALILGGGLLFLGVMLLLGRLLRIPFGDFLWPFIFIVPGVLVFLTALSTESSSGEGLSILGGILTTLGLVFFLQSVTGLWATWAYVWALVAPTSIGVSQMIYGMSKDRDSIAESGRRLAMLGLFMFGIGLVFFELIIGISGFGLASFGLPVFPILLIFIGLMILVRSLFRGR
ncbi:MAG: hypothetical protein FJZ98_00690 [Chloroflexi bacterium]|nr:hypothetical protein [Chloroflexota bacterium]